MSYTPFRDPTSPPPYTQGTQGKNPPKYLTLPPLIPEFFLGREADLTAIHHELTTDNLLLLVNEQGGIGKTTLAAKYWEKYQDQYQHLAWVYAGNGLLDALLALTQPLEMTFNPLLSSEERRLHLLSVLHKLKKPMLLVIDNLNDLGELIYVYDELHFCRNVHLLLTTRITYFEKAKFHIIHPLDASLVTALFLHHFPQQPASQLRLLEQIFEAIDFNTLLVKLLASTLRALNDQQTEYHLNSLLRDLQSKGLLKLRQTKDTKSEKSTWLRKETPEAIIVALYDLAKLEVEEKKLMSAFAVLPAEPIEFTTLAPLLGQIENLEKNLWSLVEKGWLDQHPEQFSFKVSPMVQAVIRKKKGALRKYCQELIEGMSIQLEHQPSQDKAKNFDSIKTTYVRYARSVEDCFPEIDDDLSILSDCLDSFYFNTGSPRVALHRYKITCEIEKQRYDNDPNDAIAKNRLSVIYLDLGKTYNALDNPEEAFSCVEAAAQLAQELYQKTPENIDFKSNLAIAHWLLGDLNRKLANFEAARGQYKAAEQLWDELAAKFPHHVEFYENRDTMRRRIAKLSGLTSIWEKTFEFLQTIHDFLRRAN